MKHSKLLILLSVASALLLTGCGENALKKEDFNIDPESKTILEDTKACYEKLVNVCKAETKAWSASNIGMFNGNSELEIKVYEYEHYKLLFNEYFKFMPTSTQTLLIDYQNNNYGYTFEMYDKTSSISYWCMDSKPRFAGKLDQLNTIQSSLLNMVNNATDIEQKGFDVFYDAYYVGSYYMRSCYASYDPIVRKELLDSFALTIPMELLFEYAYMLTEEQINCAKAFLNKYGDDVIYFNNYLISTTYEMYGFDLPTK